jgi:hypothetical protein
MRGCHSPCAVGVERIGMLVLVVARKVINNGK